jgi:hypothetical protein
MAVTLNCDVNSLLAQAKCFMQPCLSKEDRLALEIYFRIQGLKAGGGADYTTAGGLTLLQKDAKLWQILGDEQIDAIELFMSMDNSLNVGASFSTDRNSLQRAVKCYECVGNARKKQLLAFLKCALSSLVKPD